MDETNNHKSNGDIALVELASLVKTPDEKEENRQPLLEPNGNLNLLSDEKYRKQIEELSKCVEELSFLIKMARTIKQVRGYIFGILFALSMCMSNILVKMSPILDGSNHSAIRYLVQLIIMLCLIKSNNLPYFGPPKQRKLLIFRGFIGCLAILIAFFSIRYLDVSDVETLSNSCVLITAIIARIVLNEKLAICHLIAFLLNVIGVLFIIRPNFLFGIEKNVIDVLHLNLSAPHISSSLSTLSHANISAPTHLINGKEIIDHSNRDAIETVIGVGLVLLSATCMSLAQVTIRKLCINNVHFSISSAYPAYIGVPASIIVSIVLVSTSLSHIKFDEEAEVIGMQVMQSIFAGVLGSVGNIFLNMALKYEDPTKIGMVKMIGVFFSFILQYAFLDISVDVLGVLGALFVISGVVFVMTMKMYEKKFAESKNVFIKILFFKF